MYKFIEESLLSLGVQTKDTGGSNRDPVKVILEAKGAVEKLNETQRDIVRRVFL